MSERLLTYVDRYYPKPLKIEVRGDTLAVEYSYDGYNTDFIYLPLEQLTEALQGYASLKDYCNGDHI